MSNRRVIEDVGKYCKICNTFYTEEYLKGTRVKTITQCTTKKCKGNTLLDAKHVTESYTFHHTFIRYV